MISISEILDDLLAHPKLKHLTLERAVAYTVRFIQLIGMPRNFEQKTAKLDIEDYRALLPCDFHEMIAVRELDANGKPSRAYRYATNSFDDIGNRDLTYKVQGTIIYTSNKDGAIEIAYNAMPVDADGYPLIPDNSPFIRALELYIKVQEFTIQFDRGKLKAGVLANAKNDYAWAVAQAQTALVTPSFDEMQSITNQLNTMVLRDNVHAGSFKDLGKQERLRW